jgi:hypothetical protein
MLVPHCEEPRPAVKVITASGHNLPIILLAPSLLGISLPMGSRCSPTPAGLGPEPSTEAVPSNPALL